MYKRVSFALLRGAAPACAATACARPLLSVAIAAAPARLAGARGVRTLAFGDEKEVVHERSDFPKARLQAVLGKDTLAVLGYGPQVRACPRHRWRARRQIPARAVCAVFYLTLCAVRPRCRSFRALPCAGPRPSSERARRRDEGRDWRARRRRRRRR
jgi:hypothetical protein